jgi:hypothetical protein
VQWLLREIPIVSTSGGDLLPLPCGTPKIGQMVCD